MALPPPDLSVPSLDDNMLQFLGVPLGGLATPYGLTKLEGLDKPDVRSGNQDRPRTRGAFVGSNLLKSRELTATLNVAPPFGTYATLAGALQALRAASSTEGTTEYPLWVQLPGMPLVCTLARVLKANVVWDTIGALGQVVQNAAIQWEATDPYLYSAPTSSQTVGLAGPSTGFGFDLTFNLSFGGALSPNQMTVVNNGDVTCWPTLVIDGPCLNPVVQNQGVPGDPFVQLNMQLFSGDQVVIDCDLGTVLYTPASSSIPIPFQQAIVTGSTFFGIPAESSCIVSFNSQDTSPAAGTLTVWSADAYGGLL